MEIRSFLETHKVDAGNLTPEVRKKVIAMLDEKGLFFARRSIEQVAAILGVSRATAYNDLNAARKSDNSRQIGSL